MSRTKTLEKPNDGKHIHEIIDRTVCNKHKAEIGDPCFKIYYDAPVEISDGRDLYGSAICGARVLAAGFNGKVTPTSLSRTAKAIRHSHGQK